MTSSPQSANADIAFGANHSPRPRRLALFGEARSMRAIVVLSLFIYYWVISRMYDNVVAPKFFFGSFEANPTNEIWIQYALLTVSAFAIPTRVVKFSSMFIWLSTLLLLIPATSLSTHQSSDPSALIMMYAGAWMVYVLANVYPKIGLFEKLIQTHRFEINLIALCMVSISVLFLLAIHVGGRVSFSFLDIYDIRFDFNYSLYFPLNYLLPFAAGPLAGFIMTGALVKRNWVIGGYCMLAGLLFFGLSSHKALMFYPLFAVAGYLIIINKSGIIYFTWGLIALSLSTIYSSGLIEIVLGSSFANRFVFVPAQIHYFFFREFDEIGFQYWAESRVGLGFFSSNLPIDSVNYIGKVMTGDISVGANTGWIANGYMNAGAAGIATYAVLLSIIVYAIDVLGRRFGYAFVGGAFLVPMANLINSIDLLAGILTGGLGILFAIFFIVVRPMQVDGR